MLDIIGHFFVLYPLITFNKDSSFLKTNFHKFAGNMALLLIVALLTNVYLMDSSLAGPEKREQNLYEIFETLPKDFMKFNSTTLKHKYRELSRRYHPDKNPDSTPEYFMKIKTAYELLNDPERRKLYDVYGQTDFQYDDQMRNAFEVKYKNETVREKMWTQFQKMKENWKVFGEVMPYYFTWFLLTCFRVDRASTLNVLLGIIFITAIFEWQARLLYGTGSFDNFFSTMYSFFPENQTIGENMRLTRQLFPLIF